MSAKLSSSKATIDTTESKEDEKPEPIESIKSTSKRGRVVEFLRRSRRRVRVSARVSAHFRQFRKQKHKMKEGNNGNNTRKVSKSSSPSTDKGGEEDTSDVWTDDLLLKDKSLEKKRRFKIALIKYLSKVKGMPPKHISSKMNLDDLLNTVKQVQIKHKNSSKIRKAMGNFLKYSPELASWLAVFPKGFPHSAIVFGGLKILLEGAGRIGEGIGDVFKILGEIPKALASLEVYTKIYNSSAQIEEKSEEIYMVLIDVFEYALSWLFKNPVRKFAGSLIKGKVYLRELKGKLAKIKRIVEELKEIANGYLHENITKMKTEVGRILEITSYEPSRLAKPRRYLKESLGSFSSALRAALRISQFPLSDREELWNTIKKSREMKDWVKAAFGTLFVNGNCKEMEIPLISHFAVQLLQEATEQDIPALHYFCSDINADDCSPSHLMRSLIIQLTGYYDFDSEMTQQIRLCMSSTIFKLCYLFSDLIKKIPKSILLLIVIDGITHLENKNWDETCFVVIQLNKIAQCAKKTIQLLITAPGRSSCVAGVLKREYQGSGDPENQEMRSRRDWVILDVPGEKGSLANLDREQVTKSFKKTKENNDTSRVDSPQAKDNPQLQYPLRPAHQTWWPPHRILFPPFAVIGFVGAGTTGLGNTQNTCYMNVILQCLSGIIPLTQYFLDGSYKRHVQVDKTVPSRPAGFLATAFAKTLRTIWRSNCLFFMPQTIRDVVVELREEYKGDGEHDTVEFLEFFFSRLHEELNVSTPTEKPNSPEDSQIGSEQETTAEKSSGTLWEEYLYNNSSMIANLFHGQLGSRLLCQGCKHISNSYSVFTHLSLPIPPARRGGITFLNCLEKFLEEEILKKDSGWHCQKCGDPQEARKKLIIHQIPPILITQLKRLIIKKGQITKHNAWVDIPLELNLTNYVYTSPESNETVNIVEPQQSTGETTPPLIYDLYAICNHYGNAIKGHYTASIRRIDKAGWNIFNDKEVLPLKDQKRLVSANAYLLFWVRRN